jgi:hypothetical protein
MPTSAAEANQILQQTAPPGPQIRARVLTSDAHGFIFEHELIEYLPLEKSTTRQINAGYVKKLPWEESTLKNELIEE